jgi:hypothetical protein
LLAWTCRRWFKERVGCPNPIYIGEIADNLTGDELTLAADLQERPADKVARHCSGRDLLGFCPTSLRSFRGATNAAQKRSQSENPTVHDPIVTFHRDLLVLGSRWDRQWNLFPGRLSAASESPRCSVTTGGLNKAPIKFS